jgi:hypothetical protein
MLLSPSQYLPKEELRYSNFPDIYPLLDKINEFQTLIEPFIAAVSDYDTGTAEYIFVSISDLQTALNLSYEITDVLGRADNVCYEVLLPIRDAQQSINELVFSYLYERSPVVLDKEKTNLQQLNSITTSPTSNTPT